MLGVKFFFSRKRVNLSQRERAGQGALADATSDVENPMRIRFVWATVLITACCGLWLYAQDGGFTLRVDTTVVSLDAIVQDSNNRPVINLVQQDFQIFEDGVPQEIRHFSSAETPRSTLLLFDVTGVMDAQGPFMVRAMNVFLANLRPQDRVAVAAFGPEFEMLMNFRKLEPGKQVNVTLPKERIGSNVYDALSQGGKRNKDEKGRKSIVAMTDGRDTFMFNETKRLGYVMPVAKDSDFQKFVKEIRKHDTPIYFVALDTDPRFLANYDYEYAYLKNPADYQRSAEYARGARTPTIAEDYLAGVRQRIEILADATGGRVVYPRTLQDVVGFYDQISRELGFSYSLGYSPKTADDGKFHKIEVRVRGEGLKLTQSRDGYGGK
jgi:Ca-activated chloride channel family protein